METRNLIFGLEAFRFAGVWAFNDKDRGLVNEMFVGGTDTLIDKFAEGKDRIGIVFSSTPFPEQQVHAEMIQTSPGGTTYIAKGLNHEFWLCPALFLYYQNAPKDLYARFIPLN